VSTGCIIDCTNVCVSSMGSFCFVCELKWIQESRYRQPWPSRVEGARNTDEHSPTDPVENIHEQKYHELMCS
jgi:hypothetical protein